MQSRTIARGFSLVELLVVISIISLLVQLLLPAVQAAREAARRAQCASHLRQLALAALDHEGAHGILPSAGWGWAWVGDPNRGVGARQPGSWAYQILPFAEAQAVHDIGLGAQGAARYARLAELAVRPTSLLYCPSRRQPLATPNSYGPVNVPGFNNGGLHWFNAERADLLARIDYAANAGDRWIFWHEGPTPDQAERGEGFFNLRTSDGQMAFPDEFTGVAMQRTPIALRQITDGASQTYLFGEKWISFAVYETGTGLNDDQSCWNGDDFDTTATTAVAPQPDVSLAVALSSGGAFGGAHPSGCNMSMCDGSVKLVSYDVSPEVHRAAGNRQDD
jgi:prepilin-type N-terminal cleavage/methylation domain-containing protein/prepilin-type processing-associated H-X9-DG protein